MAIALASGLDAKRFTDDDPVYRVVPARVGKVQKQRWSEAADFVLHTLGKPGERHTKEKVTPAQGVNTLGEAPDGAWYVNRHGRRPMTIEELLRGPGASQAPSVRGRWKIVEAKTEGITPGFIIKDSEGRRYLVKFDPPTNPEMASSAEVIVTKFLYALGYHVPENYLVTFDREQLEVAEGTLFVDEEGRRRAMTERDVDEMLRSVPPAPGGRRRALASLFLKGELLGPFRFHGTRPDDPNDTAPHEHRRELRGLFVFAAWLSHHDIKSLNTLDAVVEEDGTRYVKHYLIDFGSSLGSASTEPKSPRAGNEYWLPFKPALVQMATLGLYVPRWARAKYPDLPAVGRFESKIFDPEKWKPNYPNPAFENRLPDDAFWAARQVMSFTDEQIRALVHAGQYSDPRAAEWIANALIERRDKTGETYFARVLPLDRFQVRGGRLEFEDLAVNYEFAPPRAYRIQWSVFDNDRERKIPLRGAGTAAVPAEAQRLAPGAYLAADIRAGDPRKTVTVYLRKKPGSMEVVGIERTW